MALILPGAASMDFYMFLLIALFFFSVFTADGKNGWRTGSYPACGKNNKCCLGPLILFQAVQCVIGYEDLALGLLDDPFPDEQLDTLRNSLS